MKNEIKELKAELLKVFSKFEENECEPKEGEWYFIESGGNGSLGCDGYYGIVANKYDEYYICGGLKDNGNPVLYTVNGSYWRLSHGYKLRKATESEVIEAFTKYFRSQGFVSGKTKFKSARHGNKYIYNEPLILLNGSISSNTFGCLFDSATLALATKIEEEKIMVGDNEVCFVNGGHESAYVKIQGCHYYINKIKALLALNPIFQKILDKLNAKSVEEVYHRLVQYEWNETSDSMKESIIKAMHEYHNQFPSVKVEANQLVKDLADWSRKYPRGRVYPMSKQSMDDELVKLEERAKELCPPSPPKN